MSFESNNYLSESFIYDTAQILELDINSEEFKNFLVELTNSIEDMLTVINTKDTAYYSLFEVCNNQQFFPDTSTAQEFQTIRNNFRTAIDFGTLPNASLKSVVHNIEGIGTTYTLTRTYGAATDISNPANIVMIPIPYIDVTNANANIELYADSTNVYIDTDGFDRTSFTKCIVVMEYLKY
jgi:hypothetical protein